MHSNSLKVLLWSLPFLLETVLAQSTEWESPVYNNFFEFPLPIPPIKEPKATFTSPSTGKPIDYYEVDIKPLTQQVYPNLGKTRLVGYDGISPGPTFMMNQGRESIVRFINHADRANSVHLHGSYSRAPFDGWAEDTTEPGQYKDYYYPNAQAARTLWYHDHAIDHTAENAYFGQAGFYILHDPKEQSLGLPSGDYDVPLALASKRYNSDGTLWSPEANDETDSLFGDVIHVNGQPWPYFKVEPRKYRFRFLDTSVSRTFSLYFVADKASSTKIPMTVIGSDAGLGTAPVKTSTLDISMAERYEVVFDFAAYKDQNVTLKNQWDVGADDDFAGTDRVMKFIVGNTVTSTAGNGELPASLVSVPFPQQKTTIDRSFKFERSNGEWQINKVTFADVNNRVLAKPPRGATEVWYLENSSGGWSHPIHIHLVDFQVISRVDGKRNGIQPYEKTTLKDVVWLGPNEKVKVLARYAPWDGLYMFHCHNLIHEDHAMMAAMNVTALAGLGYSETTRFIDPMEPRYRAKDFTEAELEGRTGVFSNQAIKEKVEFFASLNAYSEVDQVEKALEAYYSKGATTLATSTSTKASSSSSKTSSSSAKTTSSAKTSSSVKTSSTKAATTTTKK
ncbi:Cupredoxin [Aulographum hederae CBS 113979]|uniref:Cupredoxin n=1 Tax=Aulographum hederae CBS 113979 TaxID=1176131 RepID=A0A6G1HHD8_9PEZI|nr:Cupredoxin [Aulographum hederae CBS 113979]